jgi:hypothetical protein
MLVKLGRSQRGLSSEIMRFSNTIYRGLDFLLSMVKTDTKNSDLSPEPVSLKDGSRMAVKKIFRDVPADNRFVGFQSFREPLDHPGSDFKTAMQQSAGSGDYNAETTLVTQRVGVLSGTPAHDTTEAAGKGRIMKGYILRDKEVEKEAKKAGNSGLP